MTRPFNKLTLKEAIVGLKAMLEESKKTPDRPMAMGVSDESGHMICFCRMDGGSDFVREMTFRKCFTAAQMGEKTWAFHKVLKDHNILFYNFNHPLATCIPGGVPIVPPGTDRDDIVDDDVRHDRGQIGACAAGGGRAVDDDQRVAMIGAKAIQKLVWGEENGMISYNYQSG